MKTLSIDLGASEQRFIDEVMKSGRYANESEVVADALAELRAREESVQVGVVQIHEAVQLGLDQLNRGEVDEWDLEQAKHDARASFAGAH